MYDFWKGAFMETVECSGGLRQHPRALQMSRTPPSPIRAAGTHKTLPPSTYPFILSKVVMAAAQLTKYAADLQSSVGMASPDRYSHMRNDLIQQVVEHQQCIVKLLDKLTRYGTLMYAVSRIYWL
jgi:hypothetical protein